MVATKKYHIIITIATKQLHFVSKKKRKQIRIFMIYYLKSKVWDKKHFFPKNLKEATNDYFLYD
jgi:hypothetical protein